MQTKRHQSRRSLTFLFFISYCDSSSSVNSPAVNRWLWAQHQTEGEREFTVLPVWAKGVGTIAHSVTSPVQSGRVVSDILCSDPQRCHDFLHGGIKTVFSEGIKGLDRVGVTLSMADTLCECHLWHRESFHIHFTTENSRCVLTSMLLSNWICEWSGLFFFFNTYSTCLGCFYIRLSLGYVFTGRGSNPLQQTAGWPKAGEVSGYRYLPLLTLVVFNYCWFV